MKRLSVIIPTFNRLRTMRVILKALEAQGLSLEEFEVITVDDGSKDGTLEMLQSYRGPLTLKVDSTGLPADVYGTPRAMNQGIRLSEGEYLVFLDSDMVPRRDALERLLAAHEKWGRMGKSVAIRAWWSRRRHPLKMWLKGTSLSRYSPERTLKKDKKFQKLYRRREGLRPQDAPIAFFSVKRELAVRVDGFPEHIQCYGIDYHFQERLVELAGVRIVFEPAVYAIHGPLSGDIQADAYRWTKRFKNRYLQESWKGLSSSRDGGKK